jgi:S1-C subfamily serine protease
VGNFRKIPVLLAMLLAVPFIYASPTGAYDSSTLTREGFLTTGGIPEKPSVCGVPARARGFIEYQVENNGVWQRLDYPAALAGPSKCVTIQLQAYLVPELGKSVSFHIRVPEQKVQASGKTKNKVTVKEKIGKPYGPYLDVRPPSNPTTPIASTRLFSDTFGNSVATIFCQDPSTGKGGQGSAFAVPGDLVPNMLQHGSRILATAAHVVEECSYSDHDTVTVRYKGVDYAGKVWHHGYNNPVDLASIVTNAPMPAVSLALGKPPTVGDTSLAIGAATGVEGTVTQGQVVGVNRELLNLTTPSGPGGSGGPVFNNRGEVIGVIIAGSGSLTVAQALPSFCGTVYSKQWVGCFSW